MKKLWLALFLFACGLHADIAPNTVAYWPLATDGNDISGNGYNLIPTGSPTFETFNGKASATGFTTSIMFSTPAALNTYLSGLGTWTIEEWVATNDATGNWVYNIQQSGVSYQGFQTGGTGVYWHDLFWWANDSLYFYLDYGSSWNQDNTWCDIAVTSDSNQIRFYNNNVLIYGPVSSAAFGTVSAGYVGGYQLGIQGFANGHICQMRISNVARVSFPTTDSENSPTSTITPTITPTWTPTITPTITKTWTPTMTPTWTPTMTPTWTPTTTPTWTPTFTPSATTTWTPTSTPTWTCLPWYTPAKPITSPFVTVTKQASPFVTPTPKATVNPWWTPTHCCYH